VPGQLLCGPLAPFVCSSAILQPSAGAAELPLTVACNVTWPLAAIVTADGETVTVSYWDLSCYHHFSQPWQRAEPVTPRRRLGTNALQTSCKNTDSRKET